MRILLLIFLFFFHPLQARETLNMSEVHSFLETIALAEPASWDSTMKVLKEKYPEWMADGAPCKKLNELSSIILKQGDLDLITLLQRALRNNDELSEEKAEPFTFYYKNYQAPAFSIPDINLTLNVQSDHVAVTSELSVKRNSDKQSLVLDGQNHKVLSVSVNGQQLKRDSYRVTPSELIILSVPKEDHFKVSVTSEIDPFHNTSMEGLYLSGEFLTTQCESEGARRIFFTLDRPDVLSRITTTIIADPKKYPVRLSNGNLKEETPLPDGHIKITWIDPIPKPSYLFACVLGNFGKIADQFVTKSGKKVTLEVYVEPGKEPRAAYSMQALKLAMKFDEDFFDREYDLNHMKVVGVPDFNMGAMENKGLMVFNDAALLVDAHSGTDASFRNIATIMAHEYFHNWSGNRVTVRNWFELALKEAFTDFRAILFGEWLFGSDFIRPKDVRQLREQQFPEETSESGHPIMVESYVVASSIYDGTTYTKGREVFRALQTYIDMMVPEGFRKAQNLYFARYDGQAVTFRELLSAANDILLQNGKNDLSQFERWFNQQGTPQIKVEMVPGKLKVTQACPNPKTGELQQPFLIPFSYELLRKDGTVALPRINCVLSNEVHEFQISEEENLIPVFMHGYSAPVNLEYDYSLEELACLILHVSDPFIRWEAAQNYSLIAIHQPLSPELFKPYAEALASPKLSPLAKAQLLQIPSIRAISQKHNDYDFIKLKTTRDSFARELGKTYKPVLEELLRENPEPAPYEPTSSQMQVRELRNACWQLLADIDPKYAEALANNYNEASNFDTSFASFKTFTNLDSPLKETVSSDFYNKWKNDKVVFNSWLSAHASSNRCTVGDLKKLMTVDGYDPKNPNHIRSVLRSFITNLGRFHDPKGEGYAFLVDQILEIAKTNPLLAHNNLTVPAFIDFEKVPKEQQALMVREMKRLLVPTAPPETRDLIKKMLAL
jgi:aminopeptidase N